MTSSRRGCHPAEPCSTPAESRSRPIRAWPRPTRASPSTARTIWSSGRTDATQIGWDLRRSRHTGRRGPRSGRHPSLHPGGRRPDNAGARVRRDELPRRLGANPRELHLRGPRGARRHRGRPLAHPDLGVGAHGEHAERDLRRDDVHGRLGRRHPGHRCLRGKGFLERGRPGSGRDHDLDERRVHLGRFRRNELPRTVGRPQPAVGRGGRSLRDPIDGRRHRDRPRRPSDRPAGAERPGRSCRGFVGRRLPRRLAGLPGRQLRHLRGAGHRVRPVARRNRNRGGRRRRPADQPHGHLRRLELPRRVGGSPFVRRVGHPRRACQPHGDGARPGRLPDLGEYRRPGCPCGRIRWFDVARRLGRLPPFEAAAAANCASKAAAARPPPPPPPPPPDFDILGARVDQSGAVLDSGGIGVSTAGADQVDPALAFDGTNYLVAWSDSRHSSYANVYGARVTPGGSVLDSAGIPISAVQDDPQQQPTVASQGGQWLVAWQDARGGESTVDDIYAARVGGIGHRARSGRDRRLRRSVFAVVAGRGLRRDELPRRLAGRAHRESEVRPLRRARRLDGLGHRSGRPRLLGHGDARGRCRRCARTFGQRARRVQPHRVGASVRRSAARLPPLLLRGLRATATAATAGTPAASASAATTTPATTTTPPPPPPPPPPPQRVRCVVPRVVGRTLSVARARIRHAHCAVGRIHRVRARRRAWGRVVAQSPRAGAIRARGYPVRLAVGRR